MPATGYPGPIIYPIIAAFISIIAYGIYRSLHVLRWPEEKPLEISALALLYAGAGTLVYFVYYIGLFFLPTWVYADLFYVFRALIGVSRLSSLVTPYIPVLLPHALYVFTLWIFSELNFTFIMGIIYILISRGLFDGKIWGYSLALTFSSLNILSDLIQIGLFLMSNSVSRMPHYIVGTAANAIVIICLVSMSGFFAICLFLLLSAFFPRKKSRLCLTYTFGQPNLEFRFQ